MICPWLHDAFRVHWLLLPTSAGFLFHFSAQFSSFNKHRTLMKCQVSLQVWLFYFCCRWPRGQTLRSTSPLIWPQHTPFTPARWVSQPCTHALQCLSSSLRLCPASTPSWNTLFLPSICPTCPHYFNARLWFTMRIYLPYPIIFMFILLYLGHYHSYIIPYHIIIFIIFNSSYVFLTPVKVLRFQTFTSSLNSRTESRYSLYLPHSQHFGPRRCALPSKCSTNTRGTQCTALELFVPEAGISLARWLSFSWKLARSSWLSFESFAPLPHIFQAYFFHWPDVLMCPMSIPHLSLLSTLSQKQNVKWSMLTLARLGLGVSFPPRETIHVEEAFDLGFRNSVTFYITRNRARWLCKLWFWLE